jgi:hypothetical protein
MASLRSIFSALGVLATVRIGATADATAADEQALLVNLDDYVCSHPPYQVLMVSKSPLVIYIKNFITPSERAHLQRIRYAPFQPFPFIPVHSH